MIYLVLPNKYVVSDYTEHPNAPLAYEYLTYDTWYTYAYSVDDASRPSCEFLV